MIRQLSWSHFVAILPLSQPLNAISMLRCVGGKLERADTAQEDRRNALRADGALKEPEKLVSQELDALRDADKLTPIWFSRILLPRLSRTARRLFREGSGGCDTPRD